MTTSRLQSWRAIVVATLLVVGARTASAAVDEPATPPPVAMASTPGEGRAGAVANPLLIAIAEALERARLAEHPQLPVIEAVLVQAEELERELDRRADAVPADYRSELHDLAALVQGLDLKASGGTAARTLDLVGRDLRIKTRYLQATAGGFSFQKSLQVMVSVKTRRGEGYRVSFNPLRFVGERAARFPVTSMTNKARRLMPPGLYVMTVERDGHSVTQEIEIGESGTDEQLIEVDP